MRKKALFTFALTLLLTTLGGGPLAEETEEKKPSPPRERTLLGEYRWAHGETGDLRAVFTPAGEDYWEVSFYFRFNGQPHVYTGFARGTLTGGKLDGEVKNENRRRTFTFSGSFRGDTYRGTHAELKRGREYATGTLTLEAETLDAGSDA